MKVAREARADAIEAVMLRPLPQLSRRGPARKGLR
jgi:hypothetical protein